MSAGLQIFDASGNIVLDATYRVMRIIGSSNINGNSGGVSDSRLAQGGWVAFQPSVTCGDGFLSGGIICPSFSISGSTLTWTYPATNNPSYDTVQVGVVFYGAS